MLEGNHTYRHASAKTSIPSSLPAHIRGNVREITDVYTPHEHRDQGMATALMWDIIGKAEAMNVILVLTVGSFADARVDDGHLDAWYRQTLGFQVLQEDPRMLYRPPSRFARLFAAFRSHLRT